MLTLKNKQKNNFSRDKGEFHEYLFLKSSIIGLFLIVILGVWIAFFWGIRLDTSLEIDRQILIALFTFLTAIPIPFVGAYVALKVARLAYDIQDYHQKIETNSHLLEFINPIRNNFCDLASALNSLIESTNDHWKESELILNNYIEKKYSHLKFDDGTSTFDFNLELTQNHIELLYDYESKIIFTFSALIELLEKISNDYKSATFFNYIAKKNKIFSQSKVVRFITKDLNFSDSHCSSWDVELKVYSDLQENISSTLQVSKMLIQKPKRKLKEDINIRYLNEIYEDELIFKIDHLVDFGQIYHVANLKGNILGAVLQGDYKYIQEDLHFVKSHHVNLVKDFILCLSKVIPNEEDINHFFREELKFNNENLLGGSLYVFDATTMLNQEMKTIRTGKLLTDDFSNIKSKTDYFNFSEE